MRTKQLHGTHSEDLLAEIMRRLCSDGRLDQVSVEAKGKTKEGRYRFEITHRGSAASILELPDMPLAELDLKGKESTFMGRRVREFVKQPAELRLDGEPAGFADAVRWIRADLLRDVYGYENPHPLYEAQQAELRRVKAMETLPRPRRRPWEVLIEWTIGATHTIVWAAPALMVVTFGLAMGGMVAQEPAFVFIFLGFSCLFIASLLVGVAAEWAFERFVVPARRRRGERGWWRAAKDGRIHFRAERRNYSLSPFELDLIRDGELLPSGLRQRPIFDSFLGGIIAHDERPPSNIIESAEATFTRGEGYDSPRERRREQEMFRRMFRRQGLPAPSFISTEL